MFQSGLGSWDILRVQCFPTNLPWNREDASSVCFIFLLCGCCIDTELLAVNHRKALSPDTAFPAQLLDLVASYAYLLSRGFAAKNIIMIGDSSGGHLVLALSRYLGELHSERPHLHAGMPGALLLISVSTFQQFAWPKNPCKSETAA